MHRLPATLIAVWVAAGLQLATASAQDRASIVQRLRAELATLLKKSPAQLPVDAPVAGLGADPLTVVEWQMAAERAFRVHLPDTALFEASGTTRTRRDLTIASLAEAVATARPWPKDKTR